MKVYKTPSTQTKKMLPALSVSLVGLMSLAGAQICYAECISNIPSNTTLEQYQINPDDTVTDLKTKLVWQRCPVGYAWSNAQCVEQVGAKQIFTWQEALNYAANLSSDDDNVWRIPNTKELESLIKRNCHRPAIESFIFSDLQLTNHWTSTSAVGSSAWAVNFMEGGIIATDKQSAFSVRLVKDAE